MKILQQLNQFIGIVCIMVTTLAGQGQAKIDSPLLPRVIITSDLNTDSGDPDDKQSMGHLFMYADEVEIVSIIPDRWEVHGVEATMTCIDAYEKDFNNLEYNYQKFDYPTPDHLRSIVQKSPEQAVNSIILEAKKEDPRPLHILVWGNMKTVRDALFKAPEIASKLRIYTIATNLMAENVDASIHSKSKVEYGKRINWNGQGRNDIFNDNRFDQLWWLENDWAYNGMFEGEAPRRFLKEIKQFGELGYYIWACVQDWDWAHYFRAGDTPTLLYLLEPEIDINDPSQSSWAGKFIQPFPKARPNYWIDDAGNADWDYKDPRNSWNLFKSVYEYRLNTLVDKREGMYESYREKMEKLYNKERDRVIVLTDIEADPDDTQSLVRLLLYANQIDIKGLVATTSCWLQSEINPESIKKVIRAYGKVHSNLLKHERGYPDEQKLLSLVKNGLPKYGMSGVGEGMDSEGSDWIIKTLEEEDERPLWISVWGGVNTLAQALDKIKKSKSEKEAKRLIAKLRVYTISDQDDSGIWIRNNFPDLFYIVSPGDHYGSATWVAIKDYINGIDNSKISNSWLADNIQQGHGPLGAAYPDVAWGMEGDTPAFLGLIPNGLNVAEHPEWGGWGGRYELYIPDFSKTKEGGSIVEIAPETRKIWTNANDRYTPYLPKEYGRNVQKDTTIFMGFKETLWRWRDDFQNDFAARIDWCTKSYENTNHPPIPAVRQSSRLTVKSGEGVFLDASNSFDPDGDNLSFLWFNYPEAGTLKEEVKVNGTENAQRVYFNVPKVDKKETIHFILKVTDKGTPALSRYKRIIIDIVPK